MCLTGDAMCGLVRSSFLADGADLLGRDAHFGLPPMSGLHLQIVGDAPRQDDVLWLGGPRAAMAGRDGGRVRHRMLKFRKNWRLSLRPLRSALQASGAERFGRRRASVCFLLALQAVSAFAEQTQDVESAATVAQLLQCARRLGGGDGRLGERARCWRRGGVAAAAQGQGREAAGRQRLPSGGAPKGGKSLLMGRRFAPGPQHLPALVANPGEVLLGRHVFLTPENPERTVLA